MFVKVQWTQPFLYDWKMWMVQEFMTFLFIFSSFHTLTTSVQCEGTNNRADWDRQNTIQSCNMLWKDTVYENLLLWRWVYPNVLIRMRVLIIQGIESKIQQWYTNTQNSCTGNWDYSYTFIVKVGRYLFYFERTLNTNLAD